MHKSPSERRKEYIEDIRLRYGIIIEEHKLTETQKCGYFHIQFPIFDKSQKPGEEPTGYTPEITEHTEWVMKRVIINVLKNDWYRTMCEEWQNSHSIIGENIWAD